MEKRRKADLPVSTKLSWISSNPRPAGHAIKANYLVPGKELTTLFAGSAIISIAFLGENNGGPTHKRD